MSGLIILLILSSSLNAVFTNTALTYE